MNRGKSANDHQIKVEVKKPTFWEFLIHGKGTVSEPWSTVKEVLTDPSVQKEIKKLKQAFESSKKN